MTTTLTESETYKEPPPFSDVGAARAVSERTLLSLDWRIVANGACKEEEALARASAQSLRRLAHCWHDDCVCRGGDWDEARGECSFRCAYRTCPEPQVCREKGVCDLATGRCSEPELPDGAPCVSDEAEAPGMRCVRGACMAPPVPCIPDPSPRGRLRGALLNCPPPARPQCNHQYCAVELANVSEGPGLPSALVNVSFCISRPRADGARCNDGNPATDGDVCRNGTCLGTPRNECDHVPQAVRGDCGAAAGPGPGECWETYAACDPSTGLCTQRPTADGTPCGASPGSRCLRGACVVTAQCAGTVCAARQPQCQVGACHANVSGWCNLGEPPKADGTPCSDGRPDTRADRCLAGSCVGAERFYDCGSHHACFRHLLVCVTEVLPSCRRFHEAQCLSVATHQDCDPELRADFCATLGAPGLGAGLALLLPALLPAVLGAWG